MSKEKVYKVYSKNSDELIGTFNEHYLTHFLMGYTHKALDFKEVEQ